MPLLVDYAVFSFFSLFLFPFPPLYFLNYFLALAREARLASGVYMYVYVYVYVCMCISVRARACASMCVCFYVFLLCLHLIVSRSARLMSSMLIDNEGSE